MASEETPPLSLVIPSATAALTVVCISDTHGRHRELIMPPGDILIHAGDYTRFGRREDADDFNAWLTTLPYETKLVVQGNHEANAPWKAEAKLVLSNATLLNHESILIHIFGSGFFWPCRGHNPHLDAIPSDAAIVIAHGPVQGFVDGNKGCPALRRAVETRQSLQLVVSGHIHSARGWTTSKPSWLSWLMGTRSVSFVNAANMSQESKPLEPPIDISIQPTRT
ncbi:hypothetical protein LEN26_011843 [Aphanomyces euteiches]|nr:hypothetical protein LEN26_011843 [Aphanomyces euteiches]KAH9186523.1 hypothetical protein AeNC1_011497 [Aphanomyces euteiches]